MNRPTLELTGAARIKAPSPHQISYKPRSRRSRPTIVGCVLRRQLLHDAIEIVRREFDGPAAIAAVGKVFVNRRSHAATIWTIDRQMITAGVVPFEKSAAEFNKLLWGSFPFRRGQSGFEVGVFFFELGNLLLGDLELLSKQCYVVAANDGTAMLDDELIELSRRIPIGFTDSTQRPN
jgi:hypothetical protein